MQRLGHTARTTKLAAPQRLKYYRVRQHRFCRDDECYPILTDSIEFQISALWSLDAFTDLNGATEVIPRSSQSEEAAPEKAIMPAGPSLSISGPPGTAEARIIATRRGRDRQYLCAWMAPAGGKPISNAAPSSHRGTDRLDQAFTGVSSLLQESGRLA